MHIIEYSGVFGFIKPWTAVRDQKTKSLDYLTTSVLMGIERKLFPEILDNENGKLNKIKRHRLSFDAITFQQEVTKTINRLLNRKDNYYPEITSIIERGLLLNPKLQLLFNNLEDVEQARTQHICLCRNEDVLLPTKVIKLDNINDFDDPIDYPGFETFECDNNNENSIYCGLNRYTKRKQYVEKIIVGVPPHLTYS